MHTRWPGLPFTEEAVLQQLNDVPARYALGNDMRSVFASSLRSRVSSPDDSWDCYPHHSYSAEDERDEYETECEEEEMGTDIDLGEFSTNF